MSLLSLEILPEVIQETLSALTRHWFKYLEGIQNKTHLKRPLIFGRLRINLNS
jgi:hypothetical protein